MVSAGELVVSIVGDMEGLKKVFRETQTEISSLGSKIGDAGKQMTDAGGKMTAGITAPILAVGAGIGVTAAKAIDFDTQVRRIGTMLPGITEEGFNKIKKQSLDLSTQFGSDTASINDAMYQALSSGIPEDNIFEFMQTSEKLAIGGATDVLTSVDGLTSVVNSYGASQINAAHAADVMFQGTKLGKSTIEELSKYMADVVPIAAANKISFEDVNASLATMTIQGTRTPVAITQLKNIILELSNDTTGAAQAFKQISGQSFTDFIAKGGTVGEAINMMSKSVGEYIPTVKDMNKFTKEFDDPASQMSQRFNELTGKSFQEFIKEGGSVQQAMKLMGVEGDKTTKTVTDFFSSVDAKTGVLQLAGEGAKLYANNMTEMGKATGSTDEAYKTMSEGLGTQTNIIKEKFNALLITLGEQFLPILKDTIVPFVNNTLIPGLEKMIPVVMSIMKSFGDLSPTLQLIIVGLIGLIAAIGPVLVIIGAVASGIGAVAGLFAAGGLLASGGAIMTALGAAIGLLSAPITILIGVVALLAIAWTRDWGGIQEKAAAVWDWITTTAADLYNKLEYDYHAIIMSMATLRDNFNQIWDIISAAFTTTEGLIVSTATDLYNMLKSSFDQVVAAAQSLYTSFSGVLDSIKTYLGDAKDWVINKITELWNDEVAGFNKVVDAAQSLYTSFSEKWEAIKTYFGQAKDWVINKITELWNDEVAGFNKVVDAAQSLYTSFSEKWEAIKTYFGQAKDWIINKITELWNLEVAGFNKVVDAALALYNSWVAHWNNFENRINQAVTYVSNYLTNLYNQAKSRFDQVVAAAQALYNSWVAHWNNFENRINQAVTYVSNYLTNLYNQAKEKFNQIIQAAQNLLNDWRNRWNDIEKRIDDAKTAISTKLNDIKTNAETRATEIADAILKPLKNIKTDIENLFSDIKKAGSNLVQNLIDGINEKIEDLKKAVSKVTSAAADYLPMHSPAKVGPLSTLPHWEDFFETPIQATLSKARGTIEKGLGKITQVINKSTTVAPVNNTFSDSITIGPNNISSQLDLQDLIDKLVAYQANQRRAQGVYI